MQQKKKKGRHAKKEEEILNTEQTQNKNKFMHVHKKVHICSENIVYAECACNYTTPQHTSMLTINRKTKNKVKHCVRNVLE